MIHIIPMAGAGQRFKADGYKLPKPFIPVLGKPMFMAAINSFPPGDQYIFIAQEEFANRYSLKKEINKHLENFSIVTVDGLTEGQACTCLLAEDLLPPDSPTTISSCDYQVVYDPRKYERLINDKSVDVIVWTTYLEQIKSKSPEAFAYCRTENHRVVEIVEKRTISDTPWKDPAVVGTFTYKRASDFIYAAREMIRKNIRVNNEFYIGTSLNELIELGRNVVHFPVEKFISLGDPFELDLYRWWEEFFYIEDQILPDGKIPV